MKDATHIGVPIREQDYETVRDLIRSDQMTAKQVTQLLDDDPKFAEWYRSQSK